MKVLVEKNPRFCGEHSIEEDGVSAQVVAFDLCGECNPTRSDFIGCESGRTVAEALVMDRPDLNPRSYELLIRASIKRFLHFELEDRAKLKRTAKYVADELADIASKYPPGSEVVRTYGEYDIYCLRDEAAS